jgi:hypothetical protein
MLADDRLRFDDHQGVGCDPIEARKNEPIKIAENKPAGQVIVKGPMTKEEKAEWARWHAQLDESEREIAELTAFLQDPKNKRYRQLIENAHEKRVRDMIANAIGNWPKRNR